MRRLALLALLALVAPIVSACQSSPDQPALEPPQPSRVVPDFSKYPAVDWQQFDAEGSPGKGYLVRFITPDGFTRCNILNGLVASCVGSIVGMPKSAPDYAKDRDTFAGNDSGSCAGVLFDDADSQKPRYSFRRNGGGCPPFADTKTLDVGQKLVKYQIMCAVGEDRLTACINTTTNHGFVLQSSGSWTF
ncbi:hypothetical protein BOO86_27610 [Mycobacterium sp. CBMA 234]|uniref:hypothetical protein n=1 Tax=Mycolicibacterium sp. CBMA 234 TaxID=1918495 RepID=UPI0012DE0E8C|nr:hypothetical protein [Mycolicibacterium sp. CBMA 234]MUL68267.1 hypothetical protein [Mycolicibacterium sp. CBMA 234]